MLDGIIKTAQGLLKWFTPPLMTRHDGYHTSAADIGAVEYGAGVENCTALSTFAMVASTIYWWPFIAPDEPATCTQLGIEITTAAAAGKKIRLCLAENSDHSAHLPLGMMFGPMKILADTGDIAADSAAPFLASAAISVALTPGHLYWIGVVSDGTPTVRARLPAATLNFGAFLGGNMIFGLSSAFTYAALPVNAPVVNSFVNNPTSPTSWPLVRYKLS